MPQALRAAILLCLLSALALAACDPRSPLAPKATNNAPSTSAAATGATPDPNKIQPSGTTAPSLNNLPPPSRAPQRGITDLKQVKPPEGWRFQPIEQAKGRTLGRIKRARLAKDAFSNALIQKLVTTMQQEGAAATVPVCAKDAPKIADDYAYEYYVKLGRASWKARSVKNAPPEWAKPLMDARFARPIAMVGPKGQVGWMEPIFMADACTLCHGEADRLDPDAIAEIDKLYPQDQARGFVKGDLRGWFWVEVSKER